MDEDRFTRKRNSLVGGGLAKFEGAQAADQFARRQSSYQNHVRQSIPDIRFDENGMPISTRQLQARSHSLVAGSLYSRDGYRRGSEQLIGGEKNVRKLSKKFSAEEEEEMKANFTIPSNSRAGMFGTNRRWNVKPEWMKKRKSSLKEEFIEKNLSNLELLSPTTSPKELEEEMSSISEEMVLSSGEKTGSASDDVDGGDHSESRSSASETDSSKFSEEGSDSEGEDSNSDRIIEEDESRDVDADATNDGEEDETAMHREGNGEVQPLENKSERKILKSSKKKQRKSKRSKKSGSSDEMPPRPPPPPLPIQMCDVSDFFDASSSSDDEDGEVIRTQYGKQKLFVSKFDHVFQNSNGPLLDGRNKVLLSKISVRSVN